MIRPMVTSMIKPMVRPMAGRQYYTFDGIDDYITIPSANLVAGDTVSLKFVAPSVWMGGFTYILTNSGGFSSSLRVNSSGNFNIGGYTGTIDGAAIVSGVTVAPTDALEHLLVLTKTTDEDLTLIGARFDFTDLANFPIYNLRITSPTTEVNRFYPIDDGWANNPVIRDTINGQNGTLINGQESGWGSV